MNERTHQLTARWHGWIQPLVSCDKQQRTRCFDKLVCAYQSPPRAYHNIEHIADCLHLYDQVSTTPIHAVELAIWYHDSIYEPLSATNEQDSAEYMQTEALSLGIDNQIIQDATRLILITANHQRASKPDEQLLADIDCAILAAQPHRYIEYTRAIRSEYSMVQEFQYRKGRTTFLEGQLLRPAMFHTEWAKQSRFEELARINIAQELSELQS